MDKPRRRLEFELHIGADNMEELKAALRDIETQAAIGELSASCVSGGVGSGWRYSLSEDKSITHESYMAVLKRYLKERDTH